MSLHPGKQVSPTLRLVRMLGRGAMGSVWLADHLTLQSQVAVKFMSPAMAEDATSVRRFQQEAKAAAEIRSPHVAQVFDHGQTPDGQLYIVMELLEGESLERRVRSKGALPPQEVARTVGQICKALAKAHERGIVHRDIKPSNVFVIDSGGEEFIKLLDFGVAKFSGEEAVNMTAAGNMVGTPAFMSPEQLFHGKDTDHRGDLWSLAVVAYYALTGTRPFRGKTLGEIAVQIKGGSFAMPTEMRTDLPPDVDAWFARALNPELSERFSTAKEMAQHLESACGMSSMMTSTPSGVANQLQTFPGTSLSSPAVPMSTHRDRRVPLVIGAVLVVALLGGGAGFLLLRSAAPRVAAEPPPQVIGAPAAAGESDAYEAASAAAADAEAAADADPASSGGTGEAADEAQAAGSATEPEVSARPDAPRYPARTAPIPQRGPGPVTKPQPAQDDRLKSAADKLGI